MMLFMILHTINKDLSYCREVFVKLITALIIPLKAAPSDHKTKLLYCASKIRILYASGISQTTRLIRFCFYLHF